MKVLIISHNCISTTQSMGKTMLSLFGGFDQKDLMQLYLYPSLPNVDACATRFRITDHDALHAILRRGRCGRVIGAEEICTENGLFSNGKDKKRYLFYKKSFLARRLRDAMWRIADVHTDALKAWLREGAPDVIFYALGDDTFSQRLAVWAADYLRIPLVTYICDEFFFSCKNGNLAARLLRGNVIRQMRKTMQKTTRIVTICDDLGEKYLHYFGKPYCTVLTGSSFAAGTLPRVAGSRRISYIGNFGLNRWRSLLDIAAALQEINRTLDDPFTLTYYGEECPQLRGKVAWGGKLDESEVRRVMGESALLIHAETFDSAYRARLRYSVSTKVADCLASGVCLFAYGPAEIASIRHLAAHRAAVVVSDPASLQKGLRAALTDKALITETEQNAVLTARECHDSAQNSATLYALLRETVKESAR